MRPLKLLHPDGRVVREGDEVTDFRGNTWRIVSWEFRPAPSSGRVYVVKPGGGGFEREFYPSVFDLRWEE